MRTLKIRIIYIILTALFLTCSVSYADKSKKDSNYQINKAIPLFLRKDFKKARKIFMKVLKDDPNNIVARYYIAEIMFADVRRYDDAAKQFEIVLKLKGKVTSKKFKIRNKYIFNNSILKLGLVYLKNGQNYQAIEYINRFLNNDKDSKARIMALNSLAVAYSNLDDYEKAIFYLEEAIYIDKENLLARFNLSAINSKLIYYNTGIDLSISGRHVEAAREFVKALDVDPFFTAAHFRLALEHKLLRNYTDAENEFLRAVAINPDYEYNYRIFTELAEIYVSLNKLDTARQYVDKSLKLRDNYPYAFNVSGKINMQTNNYLQAIQEFSKAANMKYDPEFMENLKKAQDALIKDSQKK